jgi:alkylation response protein AidB-like acyl-CoA dehydrogenase
MSTITAHGGASWLLEEPQRGATFTPEAISEEHKLMAQTTQEFVDQELLPNLDALEKRDWDLARKLVRRSGEVGLFGVSVSEEYGGVDLDKVSSLIVSEGIARAGSFAVTFGAQANLCIVPIYLFGTDDQKKKYLPKLVSGELVGAYALSESGHGSDALGAATRATKQPDGSWILNGEKMWISNGFLASAPERKSTRWACTARRRRPSCCRTRGSPPRICSAKWARGTRSRSTR